MLAIELRFLRGRFHATPWGRHVNEGVPEWPPSPFRLARALYDAWKRKRPDWTRDRVEPLLRALAGNDILFRLPPARMSHLRLFYRQGSETESDKAKVFDAFAVVSPDDTVQIGLPSAALSPEERSDLEELCGLLSYFGRAESLAYVRVQDANGPWNCTPVADSLPARGKEVVRVASLCAPGRHFAVEIEKAEPAKRGRPAKPAGILQWLDAISWGSEMTMEHKLSQPPALEWVSYRRDVGALAAVPRAAPRERKVDADAIVLAVDGKVRPRIIETIRVGDEIRRRAMGAHRRVMGGDPQKVSAQFSGKDPAGQRLLDQHRHASFLSWDRDGDGVIDHVLLTSPVGFDRDELMALHRLAPLEFPDREHPSRLIPVAVGLRATIFHDLASLRFRSATPFVPTRHYRAKRDGEFGAWLRAQVERSLRDHSMPGLVSLTRRDHHCLYDQRQVRWLEFRRSRRGESPELGFGFDLELSTPVPGPFSIGGGAHFGLGLFVPQIE